ncbi:MAG: thioredoxin TrxC [Caldimonas sp.]
MLIVCPHCATLNRVPPERATEEPVCGQCGKGVLDGTPVELTDASFARFTAKTELPVVVDFWAAWCGPCRMMAPHFEQAARQLKGRVVFAKVDSDASPQTSSRFAIRSIPTMLMMKNGTEAKRQAGAVQTAQIVAWASVP